MESLSAVDSPFKWRLSTGIVTAVFLLNLGLIVWDVELGGLIGAFLVAPFIGIVVLLLGLFRKGRTAAVSLVCVVAFCSMSWFLMRHSEDTRSEMKWLFLAHRYKAQVLAQAPPADGSLRHLKWDGWGWVGSFTEVYLVFSPEDRMRSSEGAARPGVPCEVYKVHRLEKNWYVVTFYSDEMWDDCKLP